MHQLATDLTVMFQADRPGTLARAIDAIAQAGINIEGYAEVLGSFHVLTKDAVATRGALEAAGFTVSGEQRVVVVDLEDRTGAAASVFRRIADANMNVSFSYGAANNRIVVGASDVEAIARILSR